MSPGEGSFFVEFHIEVITAEVSASLCSSACSAWGSLQERAGESSQSAVSSPSQ